MVPCPKIVNLYNSGMGGVDLMDQCTAAYHLDRKSSVRFSFRVFFDLIHIACVNSYLIYYMKHSNKLIVFAKNLIHYHQGRNMAVPMLRPSKRKNQPGLIDNHGGHLPDYQTKRKRCAYCVMEGKENRTFVISLACNIPLCLVKERNCVQKHHIEE